MDMRQMSELEEQMLGLPTARLEFGYRGFMKGRIAMDNVSLEIGDDFRADTLSSAEVSSDLVELLTVVDGLDALRGEEIDERGAGYRFDSERYVYLLALMPLQAAYAMYVYVFRKTDYLKALRKYISS